MARRSLSRKVETVTGCRPTSSGFTRTSCRGVASLMFTGSGRPRSKRGSMCTSCSRSGSSGFNLGVTLTGAAILLAAALITVFFTNFVMPAGPDGLVIVAGFMASIFVFGALAMRRSRIKAQFYIAIGLGVAGLITLLIVAVFIVNGLDGPAGIERALTMAGLFLVLPLVAFFWGVMIALTPDGRKLYDEIEGFRRFIAVADAGRHAIDNAPDPTQDSLDRLVPYAVA